jgi:LuxR family transcriptional regulator, maltose regulon positive regulatory protein
MGGVEKQRASRSAPLAVIRPVAEPSGLLLESKLHGPAVRPEWVPRQRLIAAMNALKARLLLVEAPAGFGKTIMVAQWRSAASDNRSIAWVFLDQRDDDPARLWRHVVSALERACPDLSGANLLRSLAAHTPDIDGDLLPRLVNALAELSQPVVLVLDDYHLVTERRCLEQIQFLLMNLVPPAQMIIITRADPLLPLARLRATGDLAEIRMRELSFTPDEAAELVERIAAVRLSERDLATLVHRTEGWPAGISLAALSLRGRSAPGAFLRQLSGNNKYIADYLFDEVISRQPQQVRQFLAETSILDRFSGPLCEAVTGAGRAAEMIDVLQRENLFVVPVGKARRWFRYHRLFRQVLRRELDRGDPAHVAALHLRASDWYTAHGFTDDAIGHALAGGDLDKSVDLIAAQWVEYVNTGRLHALRSWLDALGDEHLSANPLAAHCAAWVAALSGKSATLMRLVPVMESGERAGRLPDGMKSFEFSVALLRGTFGFDGIRVMRESAARAIGLEDDTTSRWYPLALTALAYSRYLSGAPGVEQPVRQALVHETADQAIQLAVLFAATLTAAQNGEMDRARAYASTSRQLVEDSGLGKMPQSSLAQIASGLVYAEEGRLAEARRELERALRSRPFWVGFSPWPTFEAMLRLASVRLDMGDETGTAALLDQAGAILDALPHGAEAQEVRLDWLRQRVSRSAAMAGSLTDQERAVLLLLRSSLSMREIGLQLSISRNTVKTHVRAIYRKLGVSDRGHAVARGHQLGYLNRGDFPLVSQRALGGWLPLELVRADHPSRVVHLLFTSAPTWAEHGGGVPLRSARQEAPAGPAGR